MLSFLGHGENLVHSFWALSRLLIEEEKHDSQAYVPSLAMRSGSLFCCEIRFDHRHALFYKRLTCEELWEGRASAVFGAGLAFAGITDTWRYGHAASQDALESNRILIWTAPVRATKRPNRCPTQRLHLSPEIWQATLSVVRAKRCAQVNYQIQEIKMKKLLNAIVPLLLIAVAFPAMAQDDTKTEKKAAGKKGQQAAQPFAIAQIQKSLASLELTAEQKEKVKEVFAKHKGPLVELQKSKEELLGKEMLAKMAEARKAATAEGKKAKALTAAVNAAVGLDAEKTAKLAEITTKSQAASLALKKDVLALLTPEQQAKSAIKLPAEGKKGKKKADA